VRHVMGHTRDCPALTSRCSRKTRRLGSLRRRSRGASSVVASRTTPGYHLVTQGYLIGELVRRITARRLLSSSSLK